MPGHPQMLVPTAPVARRAVLPDDPGVALTLATELLEGDRLMANHHRGLWGYSGSGADGAGRLSIQSTGVGAGSAALVLAELIDLGLATAIRVGTCRSETLNLDLGSMVAVGSSVSSAGERALDPRLTEGLAASAGTAAAVTSLDAHADPAGAPVWDLETAALAAISAEAGVRFGALLIVSGSPAGSLGHEEVAAATAAAGRAAAAVLAS